MNIDQAVKYLEHNKLKTKLLSLVMELGFPKRFTNWVEKSLDKNKFKQKPNLIHNILYSFYYLITFIIFGILMYFLPNAFTMDSLLFYFISIMLMTFLIVVVSLKSNFFDFFAHDHFFNLLHNKQSDFIMRRIKFVYESNIIGFLLPMTLPLYFFSIFYLHQYFIIIIYPLLIIFSYLFIQLFGVFFWYVNVLVRRIVILKFIFGLIKTIAFLVVFFGFTSSLGYFVAVYHDGSGIRESTDLMKIYLIVFSGLLILNGILYMMKRVPKMIIDESYKKIIYAEGFIHSKKRTKKDGFLLKLFSLGMFHLDEKEQLIYEKDTKKLLRKENGKTYVVIIGIMMFIGMILAAVLWNNTKSDLTTLKAQYIYLYFLINVFLVASLGYFVLLHKAISSFSAEGINHIIYKRVNINYLQVFKAKLYFNRYFVFIPFLPFFFMITLGINTVNDFIMIMVAILYWFGITNIVMKAIMIEDFQSPKFNGVYQVGLIKNKSSMLSGFYNFFLLYVFIIFPIIFLEIGEVINFWIFVVVVLALIYLVNVVFYVKVKKLKKAENISYGGVVYAKGK